MLNGEVEENWHDPFCEAFGNFACFHVLKNVFATLRISLNLNRTRTLYLTSGGRAEARDKSDVVFVSRCLLVLSTQLKNNRPQGSTKPILMVLRKHMVTQWIEEINIITPDQFTVWLIQGDSRRYHLVGTEN